MLRTSSCGNLVTCIMLTLANRSTLVYSISVDSITNVLLFFGMIKHDKTGPCGIVTYLLQIIYCVTHTCHTLYNVGCIYSTNSVPYKTRYGGHKQVSSRKNLKRSRKAHEYGHLHDIHFIPLHPTLSHLLPLAVPPINGVPSLTPFIQDIDVCVSRYSR